MSNKINVIPFKQEHLDLIDPKENYGQGDCPKVVMTTAFTFMLGEKAIAIIGGFPFVPGVIHFWAFLSKEVHRYPIEFHKKCLQVMNWYETHEKPRRIQWEVKADYEPGCRWAEAMGLKREGLMPGWGTDGSPHYLYGRVNPLWQS